MSEFLKTLLALSLSGTLLTLFLLLTKPLYRERFSKRWQYYIWLAAALRFLLPLETLFPQNDAYFAYVPEVTITDYVFEMVEKEIPGSLPGEPKEPVVGSESVRMPDVENMTGTENMTDMKGAPDTENMTGMKSMQDMENMTGGGNPADGYGGFMTCAFLVWEAVALSLFVRKMTAYQSFVRALKRESRATTNMEMLTLLAELTEKMGVKRRVELWESPLVDSPVTVGFRKSKIVLPVMQDSIGNCVSAEIRSFKRDGHLCGKESPAGNRQTITAEELSCIFRHELTHCKRRDMLYKWFVQLLVCIHWFNPFAYLLRREVNKACELACDEAVVASLDAKARRSYGDMLLAFVRRSSAPEKFLPFMTLTEGGANLKERLGAIMKFKKKSKAVGAAAVVSTIIVCSLFVATGVYAAPVKQNAEDKGSAPTIYEDNVPVIYEDAASAVGDNDVADIHENDASVIREGDMSIIYESADILHYSDGQPYIHDVLSNRTDKTIIAAKSCMLAYDEDGMPLKLHWYFMDSSAESTYECVAHSEGMKILPGETRNYDGGWSLYEGETLANQPEAGDDGANRAAYVLFCLKEVTFEDESVWSNPGYESWLDTFKGRRIDVDVLQNYYPYACNIVVPDDPAGTSAGTSPQAIKAEEEVLIGGVTRKNKMTVYPGCIFLMKEGDSFHIAYHDSVSGKFRVGLMDENGNVVESDLRLWQEGDASSIEICEDGTYHLYVDGVNENAGWLNTSYSFLVSYETEAPEE